MLCEGLGKPSSVSGLGRTAARWWLPAASGKNCRYTLQTDLFANTIVWLAILIGLLQVFWDLGYVLWKMGEVFFWDRARSHWSEAWLHRPSTDWFFPGNPWANYLPRKSFDPCNCEDMQTNSSLPLSLSHSTYYYFVTKFQMFLLSCLINAFLMILQLLHIFWSYLILQMVFGVILHGAVWKIFFSSVPPLLMSKPEIHSGPCMSAGKGWEKWDYSKKTAQKLLKAHGESCIDTIVYGMSLKFSFQCTRSSHDYRLPK